MLSSVSTYLLPAVERNPVGELGYSVLAHFLRCVHEVEIVKSQVHNYSDSGYGDGTV